MKMKMKYMKELSMLMFGASTLAAGTANADIVHLDDVIIEFSLCVGNDCVNGESFGFDTIRLKENNLRINFDDTSTSASFPSNDWRIRVNDSSNGGGNYFVIEDSTRGRDPFRIDAGAPANSIRVDSAGDVGIGSSDPVVELHVVDGDSPTLRLEQNGSNGFTPQTFDMVSNEANFFIRDVTNGSQLPFRIKPGADTDSLFIAADNNIGIGTDSPATSMHIREASSGSDAILRIENASTTNGDNAELELNTDAQAWTLRSNTVNGTFTFVNATSSFSPMVISPLSQTNLLQVGFDSGGAQNAANINVNGSITATGTITPDYVFQPEYDLLPMEEHAKLMWKNSHLPHVEKAKLNRNGKEYFDMVTRSQDLLEELEIAHIYIQQLNEKVKNLEAEKKISISSLEARLSKLEEK